MSFYLNIRTSLAAFVPKPRSRSTHQRFGGQLVLQILLANLLLSIGASSIQLYFAYHRDVAETKASIEYIDRGFRSGMEEALWEYDFALAQSLLAGISSMPDVAHVALSDEQGGHWEIGTRPQREAVFRRLDFNYTNANGFKLPVGQLEIWLSLKQAKIHVQSQLWTLLLSNFAKSICASLVMLRLMERGVGRHLKAIGTHVSRYAWQDSRAALVLDRTKSNSDDALDQIVTAINKAKKNSRADFQALLAEVAQRRSAETRLRESTTALLAANLEQSQLTYAISHDLKSPINTLSMLLNEVCDAETKHMSEDSKNLLDASLCTVDRMERLIRNIVQYSQVVNFEEAITDIDLAQLMQDIIQDNHKEIEMQGAIVTSEGLPTITGNPVQLRFLLEHMLSNALKFHDPERVTQVCIDGRNSTADMAVITFTDNGIGINGEFHDRIFDMFQRLYTYDIYVGTGLGLPICKRVVTNHKGEITVKSTPGRGSCFTICLPQEHHE